MEDNNPSCYYPSLNGWNQDAPIINGPPPLLIPHSSSSVLNPQMFDHEIQAQPSNPIPSLTQSPDSNGYLWLKGSPGLWIQYNPSASHLSVKHLHLSYLFVKEEEHVIDHSIDQLFNLTRLDIYCADSLKWLPNSMANLPNLHYLEFIRCKALPENMGVLNMCSSLTQLSLYECNIKSLPESISTLSTLSSLELYSCDSLTELPDSLGQLGSLKCVSLKSCRKLQSLPNSMANLLKLESLFIHYCDSLKELPDNLKVTYLRLTRSNIKFIPRGLVNLHHLDVTPITRPDGWFANLKDSINFQILSQGIALGYPEKLPNDLEELHELILLDIRYTRIKCLPWSITELTKLRFLLLPWGFRLETLPSHLNDSISIFVQDKHIRKTWKELKKEIGVLDIPIAQEAAPYPFNIFPPGYLLLEQDVGEWICDNYNSLLLVKMLELELPYRYDVEQTKNALGKLSNLTHLYISHCEDECWIPDTFTGLRHLSLERYDPDEYDDPGFQSCNLTMLSNLEYLDLYGMDLQKDTYLPVSLRRLSLVNCFVDALPNDMAALSNLITLELYTCEGLYSLPENLNIVRLKLDSIINPLPLGLRELEILSCDIAYCNCCELQDCRCFEQCLSKLVNLDTLSITCYWMKSLPSIGRLPKLRVLQLKDCFSLSQLPSDLDELIGLETLDISGTRIKSLPDSVMKLPNLHHVTLPKCFRQESLLRNLQGFIIDDTYDIYYKHMKYYDSRYETSPEQSAIPQVPACLQLNDKTEVSSNKQNSDSNSHIEDQQMITMTLKSNEEITPFVSSNSVPEDNHHVSENEQNKKPRSHIKKGNLQKINIAQETIQQLMSKNITLVDAAKQLQGQL